MESHIVPFSTYVVKVVSRCNLNCSYCYMYNLQDKTYRNQPPKMSLEVTQWMAKRIRSHAERHGRQSVHIILHGGEPLMAGTDYLHQWLETVSKELGPPIRPHFSMQSN